MYIVDHGKEVGLALLYIKFNTSTNTNHSDTRTRSIMLSGVEWSSPAKMWSGVEWSGVDNNFVEWTFFYLGSIVFSSTSRRQSYCQHPVTVKVRILTGTHILRMASSRSRHFECSRLPMSHVSIVFDSGGVVRKKKLPTRIQMPCLGCRIKKMGKNPAPLNYYELLYTPLHSTQHFSTRKRKSYNS